MKSLIEKFENILNENGISGYDLTKEKSVINMFGKYATLGKYSKFDNSQELQKTGEIELKIDKQKGDRFWPGDKTILVYEEIIKPNDIIGYKIIIRLMDSIGYFSCNVYELYYKNGSDSPKFSTNLDSTHVERNDSPFYRIGDANFEKLKNNLKLYKQIVMPYRNKLYKLIEKQYKNGKMKLRTNLL